MPEFFFEAEQGSPEWFALRTGIATASDFGILLSKSRDNANKSRRTLLLKKAGEILTGQPAESFTNAHMERGKLLEPEACDLYAEYHELELEKIGFIRNEIAGCSPDRLIAKDGALEVKTALPHIHLDILLRGEFPPEHIPQCQGVLWVSGREWIDLAVYWPQLPLFVKRAYRDEPYIDRLESAVRQFNDEVAEIVERVRSGQQPSFKDQLRQSVDALEAEQWT